MDPDRELVLCFDGTGNTFRADGGESNILKIFRMLDRTKENRYCYYQRMSLLYVHLYPGGRWKGGRPS